MQETSKKIAWPSGEMLISLLAVSLLVLVVLGWLIDHNSLLKQKYKLLSHIANMESASNIASMNTHISESDSLVLLIWCGKGNFFRTVHRRILLKEGGLSDFKDLDEVINYELICCIDDAFRLESDLIRLNMSPTALEVAKESWKYLKCKDQSEFWEIVSELELNIKMYKHFYDHFEDPNSTEHLEFVAFLDRVFSEQGD